MKKWIKADNGRSTQVIEFNDGSKMELPLDNHGNLKWLQYMKRYNFMKRYQEMNKKALSGDVNSAKYVDEMDKLLDKMSVDKSTESEIDKLLQGVNINAD